MIKLSALAFLAVTLWPVQTSEMCKVSDPPEVGQVACCCYDAWGNQCCAWVYVCPGPVPGCPCAY